MNMLRVINNTTETCTWLKDTCIEDLKSKISNFYFQECKEFIERLKECRHQTVLKRQLAKFEWLWQRLRVGLSNNISGHSKIHYHNNDTMTVPGNRTVIDTDIDTETTSITSTWASQTTTMTATTSGYVSKWIRNLLGTPLTAAQVLLLVHGPNFAVTPRHPPMGIHNHGWAGLLEARATQHRWTWSWNEKSPETFPKPKEQHHKTRSSGTCRAQEGPTESHPYCRQRGSHSGYGQRRI